MIIEQKIKHHGDIYGETLRLVKDLVMNAHPGIRLVKKYTLPFFQLKKDICYLDIQKGKPILGIVQGIHIDSIRELLDFKGRKFVGHYSLLDLNEVRLNDLQFIIDEIIIHDLSK